MEKDSLVPQRKLGSQGLVVSAQGLGTMGMSAFYDNEGVSEDDKIATIGRALELGINFLDTAWIYVNQKTGETNEELVGKALKKFGREKFVVATKFGLGIENGAMVTSGKPDFVKKQCEESLKRLGIDTIDLYYMHRMDPNTPIEETMSCLLELQKEGKIKYAGLSEVSASLLERAHKVMPVTAIQMEWSLQSRDIEEEVVPMARKLGVGIVAYSPLGRGFLSRTFTKKEEIKEGDFRSTEPRFTGDNIEKNLKNMEIFEEFAKNKGVSAAQLALGWVHSRGEDVFPIPGTKSAKRVEENAKAVSVNLSKEEWEEIEKLVTVNGDRYSETFKSKCHNEQ